MNRKSLKVYLANALPGYERFARIADDASFRQYYRVWQRGLSYIVMDAPPAHESVAIFVQVATGFAQAGLNVPEIIDVDWDDGYLLLSDFGDQTLQTTLTSAPQMWLSTCIAIIHQLQTQGGQHLLELPEYDNQLLLGELSLFPEWFVTELLAETLSSDEERQLCELNQLLIDSAQNQPQVWVHRDFHCRNLMKVDDHQVGIIDFQDAVLGPITYDLVSLLKDCYIRYPKTVVADCLKTFYLMAVEQDRYYQDFAMFQRAFDWMGLQRHLKVLGIFARLSRRDGKHRYLNDLPLVFDYVLEVVQNDSELQRFLPLFRRLAIAFERNILQ